MHLIRPEAAVMTDIDAIDPLQLKNIIDGLILLHDKTHQDYVCGFAKYEEVTAILYMIKVLKGEKEEA